MKLPTIAFEGLDGAGKSFGLEKLRQHYESQGTPVTVVPSIPYEIFTKLHNTEWYSLKNPNALYMQYLAYEVNNFYKNIEAELGKSVVLIDRYIGSCFAYNRLGNDSYDETFKKIMNLLSTEFFRPDITFIFDVPDDVLQERYQKTNQPDMVKNMTFATDVREHYKKFYQNFGRAQKYFLDDQKDWDLFYIRGDMDPVALTSTMLTHITDVLRRKGYVNSASM